MFFQYSGFCIFNEQGFGNFGSYDIGEILTDVITWSIWILQHPFVC